MTFKKYLKSILTLAAAGLALEASAKNAAAEVKSLPGLQNMTSKIYSGMYNVSSTRGLFYTLVESESDPVNDPLLVWFSGGPGGASTFQLMYGNGPYVFIDNKTIFPNENAWSKKTNLLFVDNPAGVGYSWAKRSLDLTTNDYQFSLDAISFITQFFKEWPELTKNPLFITGQSYGGIYAPYLTF
jgi:carboxypeptidase C (cathepsin A)